MMLIMLLQLQTIHLTYNITSTIHVKVPQINFTCSHGRTLVAFKDNERWWRIET